jgi:hypothetical protein
MEKWCEEVLEAEEETGVKVANLYSGHGTYATLGLSHTDKGIRDRFLHKWLKPMVDVAGKLKSGFGFYCHAFPVSYLNNRESYYAAKNDLYSRLAELVEYADGIMHRPIAIEQMYTPHQIPWTIEGSEDLLKSIYQTTNKPLYITIDVGHQSGQRKFSKPDKDMIRDWILDYRNGNKNSSMYLGHKDAELLFYKAVHNPNHDKQLIDEIMYIIEDNPFLFSAPKDSKTHKWLGCLGSFSPFIHLQQTDGSSSSHRPFTQETNREGIVKGPKVLEALYKSYEMKNELGVPRADEIYLTLEIFSRTADLDTSILQSIDDSIQYWREFIPKDGIRLDDAFEATVKGNDALMKEE